ncbi:MAG: mycothiol system anti-sigma-R factor [Jatrophihabitans sp.]
MGFGPGGLDCDEVLHEVFLYLDEETDPAERSKIRAHLEACSPCLKQFGLEADVKSLVARHCGGDRAPDELRTRIRARITQVTLEVGHVEYRAE